MCWRSAAAAAFMAIAGLFVFASGPNPVDAAPFWICLGAWGAGLVLFVVLARLPGRLSALREGAWGLLVALVAMTGLEHLPFATAAGARQILFPPNASVRYTTSEFDVTLTSNNLGFRDRDFVAARTPGVPRIVAVGDSFTYGWGLPLEQSWPKQLEKLLGAQHVEVANLGAPGAGPYDYEDIVAKAVPLLRPDLVIVGVTEENDLWQSEPEQRIDRFRAFLSRPLPTLFPNLSDWLYQRKHPHDHDVVTATWAGQVAEVLARATPADQQRFAALPPDIQAQYRTGRLNPSLLDQFIFRPGYIKVFHLQDPVVQRQLAGLAGSLSRMRDTAARYGARMIVVAIPAGYDVNRACWEGQRRMGFDVPAERLTFDTPDQVVKAAAERAQVPFYTFLDAYRKHLDDTDMYFPLDMHPAAGGNRLLAESLAPIVSHMMTSLAER
ncbi:MAG: SGNH/GDSL hydrolase family protein [Candidatus Xenobia bacterium]